MNKLFVMEAIEGLQLIGNDKVKDLKWNEWLR